MSADRPASEATENGVRVRELAHDTDGPGWRRMRGALWPDADGEDAAAWLERCRTRDAATFVAERADGVLVGFAEAQLREHAEGCDTSPVGYVEGWYVAPGSRGRGVGRALVAAVEAWAVGRGAVELASDTETFNELSQACHAALGFDEVERVVLFRKRIG